MYSLQVSQNTREPLLDPQSPSSEPTIPYDPFQSPPNFEMAQSHGLAKRIYRPKPHVLSASITKKLCPCCGLPINGEPLSITSKLEDLYHLGSGYALYFRLTKYCIGLLAIIFAFSGLFNIYTNFHENNCAPEDDPDKLEYCIQDYIINYALPNKRNNISLLNTQLILNLLCVVAIFCFFQYTRYKLRKTVSEAEHLTTTPSDYTIRVVGIPPETKDEDIISWIEGLGDSTHHIKCKKVNRSFDISDYIKLHERKDRLVTQSIQEHDHISKYVLQEDIYDIDTHLRNLKGGDLKFTNTVFISFEKPDDVKFLLERSQGGILAKWYVAFKRRFGTYQEKFNGIDVTMTKAPEPTDIIWENLGHGHEENRKQKRISDVWGAVLIIICFLIIVGISWGQSEAVKHLGQKSFQITALSGLASVLVVTINTLIAYATLYLSKREKHSTYTAYFTGVARRLAISMCINTAFTTLFAKLVSLLFSNSPSQNPEPYNFYRPGGLLENIFFVFLSNAILTPLYTIFNPFHYLKKYQRWKALREGETCTMTQQKAHEIFELTEVDLSYQNSFLVKTVLVSAFFAPALPMGLVISIIGLIINYWVDKWTLLRRNALPISLDHALNTYMLRLLEWVGFMFAIGNLLFAMTLKTFDGSSVFSNVYSILIVLTLMLSLMHIIFPLERLNAEFFRVKLDSRLHYTYDEARVLFPTDYDIENPVTCREGLQEFIQLVKEKGADSAALMKSSIKKGAFNALQSGHLKELVKKDRLSESQEMKKEHDLDFLEEYASQVHHNGLSLSKQKFNKDKDVSLDKLFNIQEENDDSPNVV